MKKKIIITVIILICLIGFFAYTSKIKQNIIEINKENNKPVIYKHSLPLIDDDKKFIEKQTKLWIDKRNKNLPCYGLLEKDKILMAKWMEEFKINSPKIHYYDYYDDFSYGKFSEIINQHKNKRLVIKISHLQSNFGIIIVKEHSSEEQLKSIYSKCIEKFKSSFVCNHDKNDAPSNKEIKQGKKESYYKLYETIKPGIIIQDFFQSDGSNSRPIEIKILCLGGKIIRYIENFGITPIYSRMYIDKMDKVFQMAKEISSKLGAVLVRVDIFVKESDNPYIPYLNEISLSPNGGMRKNWFISQEDLDAYKQDILKSIPIENKFLDKLLKECPKRDLPISKYMTDGDNYIVKDEKFKF